MVAVASALPYQRQVDICVVSRLIRHTFEYLYFIPVRWYVRCDYADWFVQKFGPEVHVWRPAVRAEGALWVERGSGVGGTARTDPLLGVPEERLRAFLSSLAISDADAFFRLCATNEQEAASLVLSVRINGTKESGGCRSE